MRKIAAVLLLPRMGRIPPPICFIPSQLTCMIVSAPAISGMEKAMFLSKQRSMNGASQKASAFEKDKPPKPPATSQSVGIPVFAHDLSKVKVHASAPRDATFVAVNSPQEFETRLAIANRLANEKFLAESRRSLGTISDADEFSAKAKELEDAKAVLQSQFGEGWGLFFFWTRGGGQTGEGSPLWMILNAGRPFNTRMGTAYPPPSYPTAPRISPNQLPVIPLTERDR